MPIHRYVVLECVNGQLRRHRVGKYRGICKSGEPPPGESSITKEKITLEAGGCRANQLTIQHQRSHSDPCRMRKNNRKPSGLSKTVLIQNVMLLTLVKLAARQWHHGKVFKQVSMRHDQHIPDKFSVCMLVGELMLGLASSTPAHRQRGVNCSCAFILDSSMKPP